jgi:hypothetical protein
MPIAHSHRPYALAAIAGAMYGIVLRLLMHWPHFFGPAPQNGTSLFFPNDFWVMTAGFLIVAPFFIGWITVQQPAVNDGYHWGRWIFAPWLAILLSEVFVFQAGWEGAICVVMALPITLIVSSIGGIAGGLTARNRFRQRGIFTTCFAFLPLVLAGVENSLKAPLEVRTVDTEILIHAPAPVVWRNIERVRAIAPAEVQPNWTHRIGFPLPVEATLDHEGVGGVRHASFHGGLLFVETIYQWEPLKRIAFTIAADTEHIPATTLDEHVTIGGRYFDVLDGEYDLEPLANGDILLHLSSRERLSTDFNAYAGLWSDGVMRDLQESILLVVKHRCEEEALK